MNPLHETTPSLSGSHPVCAMVSSASPLCRACPYHSSRPRFIPSLTKRSFPHLLASPTTLTSKYSAKKPLPSSVQEEVLERIFKGIARLDYIAEKTRVVRSKELRWRFISLEEVATLNESREPMLSAVFPDCCKFNKAASSNLLNQVDAQSRVVQEKIRSLFGSVSSIEM